MNYLILSAHDYRSPRRVNMHFIAEQLALRGTTRFFSLRYSSLSKLTSDPRLSLDERANVIETYQGVDCFLWKTQLHPFNTRLPFLSWAESLMYEQYRQQPHPVLVEWIREATTVVLESGISPIFFDLIKEINPNAEVIYIASDDLDTINVAGFVKDAFQKSAPLMKGIFIPSLYLLETLPVGSNAFFVPHGIEVSMLDQADPSPYKPGINAVSVGSMLFDPQFFHVAAEQFPEMQFHVIGGGSGAKETFPSNVVIYDEMRHTDTLKYIKHANFGIAPYRSSHVPKYLCDTSMKLMQYDLFALPAVCPFSVVGSYSSRFGYEPGDPESIKAAVLAASTAPHQSSRKFIGWADVADRILDPQNYQDTEVAHEHIG